MAIDQAYVALWLVARDDLDKEIRVSTCLFQPTLGACWSSVIPGQRGHDISLSLVKNTGQEPCTKLDVEIGSLQGGLAVIGPGRHFGDPFAGRGHDLGQPHCASPRGGLGVKDAFLTDQGKQQQGIEGLSCAFGQNQLRIVSWKGKPLDQAWACRARMIQGPIQ